MWPHRTGPEPERLYPCCHCDRTPQILDTAGLVSPTAVPYLRVPDDQRLGPAVGAVSLALVRDARPDYLVTLPVFAERNVLDSEWFAQMYVLVHQASSRAPACGWAYWPIHVFARYDTALAHTLSLSL